MAGPLGQVPTRRFDGGVSVGCGGCGVCNQKTAGVVCFIVWSDFLIVKRVTKMAIGERLV